MSHPFILGETLIFIGEASEGSNLPQKGEQVEFLGSTRAGGMFIRSYTTSRISIIPRKNVDYFLSVSRVREGRINQILHNAQ